MIQIGYKNAHRWSNALMRIAAYPIIIAFAMRMKNVLSGSTQVDQIKVVYCRNIVGLMENIEEWLKMDNKVRVSRFYTYVSIQFMLKKSNFKILWKTISILINVVSIFNPHVMDGIQNRRFYLMVLVMIVCLVRYQTQKQDIKNVCQNQLLKNKRMKR